MGKITKAVIPVAGLGTRFLPATKAMPKEMLPVVDKPVIQYVVEEAVSAGAPHILFVTGRNKNALENHFDRAFELEARLDQKGDRSKLEVVEAPTELADIHYVRQGDALGLGHAVGKAEVFVGNEPFLLLLGDEIIHHEDNLIEQMMHEALTHDASVVALMEVPESEIHKYGVAVLGEQINSDLFVLEDLVEKPSKDDAPSRFAVVGRYILQPTVFKELSETLPGLNGEIQLTDALAQMANNPGRSGKVLGHVLRGRRFDMGSQLSFLQATIELALERQDIGDDLSQWLNAFQDPKTSLK
jgi:UTP--glucose-1-phosphate uridylyltransferase